MTTKEKLMTCGAICVAVVLMTSCAGQGKKKGAGGPCEANVKAHMPFITCQPLDVVVALPGPGHPDKTATFSVDAESTKGTQNTLTYLWYAATNPAHTESFEPISGATGPQLTINPVKREHFGRYFCAIGDEGEDGTSIVHSRVASLGGTPSGSGGVFLPVDDPVSAGTLQNICVPPQAVSGYYDRFLQAYTPTATQTGLKCKIMNKSSNVFLANTDYYLNAFVNVQTNGCMTNFPGTTDTVGCDVIPGYRYVFTAYFKSGHVPPAGTILELQGEWQPVQP
jgi:hypothetical protein